MCWPTRTEGGGKNQRKATLGNCLVLGKEERHQNGKATRIENNGLP